MSKVWLFIELFFIQIVLYVFLVINFRAVAQANIAWSVGTDTIIAAMNFFVIRKIASSENSTLMFTAYTLGSAVGSVAGIVVSKLLLGH